MWNWLETCTFCQQEEKTVQGEEEEQGGEQRIGYGEEKSFEKGSFRVKILLTKEELEWLLLQLRQKGGKSLQDALEEMEKGRGKADQSWKPSLESIMEAPEVQVLEV